MKDEVKSALFDQIQNRYQNENDSVEEVPKSLNLSDISLCDTIDFLYLNFDTKKDEKIKSVYESLVDQLKERISVYRFHKSSTSSNDDYNFVTKAFRILSFERSSEFQYANFESFYSP